MSQPCQSWSRQVCLSPAHEREPNRHAHLPLWKNCHQPQMTSRRPGTGPSTTTPSPKQQWSFLSYFSAAGRRHASSYQSSLDIKASSVMSKAEGRNSVNFIILGYSTVLMNRGDLGAGGVTDKECGQKQQMGDLVLLINFFPSTPPPLISFSSPRF